MDVSLESKALSLLEAYEGGNNYILELKRKSQINKKSRTSRLLVTKSGNHKRQYGKRRCHQLRQVFSPSST